MRIKGWFFEKVQSEIDTLKKKYRKELDKLGKTK